MSLHRVTAHPVDVALGRDSGGLSLEVLRSLFGSGSRRLPSSSAITARPRLSVLPTTDALKCARHPPNVYLVGGKWEMHKEVE
ncbi:hypothetical protein PAXINDRAFT_15007 [Paxillus involutus ATCC 200175]|uniref:Uncharacterized protein n=1 Tax=Paxillus involutus ATCC 200175 TaxID=664439 RepID=A0A0C9T8X6_PAXIN|nr:hypothetical protein PAXINDRAFT_15007 [Paxillus involutus ATCC 200175]